MAVIETEELELVKTDEVSFRMLLDESLNIQALCSDYKITKANDTNVRLNELGNITYIEDEGEIRNSPISRFALGQICSKIGVPSQYIDKCVKTGRIELAQDNMTSWLSDYNGNLFIREYNNSIRGVLSQKFATCDTPEILEVLDDVVPSDYVIKGYYLSPERFHLRVMDRDFLPVDGEDLLSGFTINSSDVGRSQLAVNYILFKQVCSNGLCLPKGIGDLFTQKHIGISAELFREELKKSIEMIPSITMEMCSKIEYARNSGIAIKDFDNQKEIESTIKMLRNNLKMSEEQATKVINLFEYRLKSKDYRYENNNWGLINSITEVAKETTLERRIEIEKGAGSILVA